MFLLLWNIEKSCERTDSWSYYYGSLLSEIQPFPRGEGKRAQIMHKQCVFVADESANLCAKNHEEKRRNISPFFLRFRVVMHGIFVGFWAIIYSKIKFPASLYWRLQTNLSFLHWKNVPNPTFDLHTFFFLERVDFFGIRCNFSCSFTW